MLQSPLTDGLAQRLQDAAHAEGGWSYRASTPRAAEPTALACLALAAADRAPEQIKAGLSWLRSRQQPDGSIPVAEGLSEPAWTTALALLAIASRDSNDGATDSETFVRRCADWLLRAAGRPTNVRTSEVQHDATLIGWSWVDGTHSWVEPTAYAVLALRCAGEREHARVREGVKLILDRAIPSGGWNYGNSAVLANTLRPFPETTGVALTALAGEPHSAAIDRAISFLNAELPRIRAPLSLGWGLIGLTAWDARPEAADDWLVEAVEKTRARRANSMHEALLLLASRTVPAFACKPSPGAPGQNPESGTTKPVGGGA